MQFVARKVAKVELDSTSATVARDVARKVALCDRAFTYADYPNDPRKPSDDSRCSVSPQFLEARMVIIVKLKIINCVHLSIRYFYKVLSVIIRKNAVC